MYVYIKINCVWVRVYVTLKIYENRALVGKYNTTFSVEHKLKYLTQAYIIILS